MSGGDCAYVQQSERGTEKFSERERERERKNEIVCVCMSVKEKEHLE